MRRICPSQHGPKFRGTEQDPDPQAAQRKVEAGFPKKIAFNQKG
jgi:hypothetical protein